MKILLADTTPAYLAPGGKAVLASRLRDAISACGVEADFDRWWDSSQKPDLIHHLGVDSYKLRLSRSQGVRNSLTLILDYEAGLPRWRQVLLGLRNRMFLKTAPRFSRRLFAWAHLADFDAVVFLCEADLNTAIRLFPICRQRCHVIPHGVEGTCLARPRLGPLPDLPHRYLVSVGAICGRKNSVFLAEAARAASVPVVFLGRHGSDETSYCREFMKLVDGRYVIHRGFVGDAERDAVLENAAGFVLLSHAESGCVAVHEAAAMGQPLLLSDQAWARHYPSPRAISHCSTTCLPAAASSLRGFLQQAKRLSGPSFEVISWQEVGRRHVEIFRKICM